MGTTADGLHRTQVCSQATAAGRGCRPPWGYNRSSGRSLATRAQNNCYGSKAQAPHFLDGVCSSERLLSEASRSHQACTVPSRSQSSGQPGGCYNCYGLYFSPILQVSKLWLGVQFLDSAYTQAHAGTFPTAPPSKVDISKSHKVEGALNTWIRS